MGPVAVTTVALLVKTWVTIDPFEANPNNGKHVDPVPNDDVDR
jgi:hypothetical protein